MSAALTGVLFLLILLLVAGWNLEPLQAALIVTALPIGAVAGAQIKGGGPTVRAAAGCLLVGGGVAALAWLPDANGWWTVPPQLLAGVGMGLSLPALGGELLPEHTARDAAVLLTIRHFGIAIALVLIAPVAAHELTKSLDTVKVQGVALILDARLPPQDKLKLAPKLLDAVDEQQPRSSLKQAVAKERASFSGGDLVAYDQTTSRADDILIAAAGHAFLPAVLIAGALAILGALFLVPRLHWTTGLAAAAAAAVITPAAYAFAHHQLAPPVPKILDPCKPRPKPHTGGISGVIQDQALHALDELACKNGSSREELVLALASTEDAKAYKKKYGINPRSTSGLIEQGLQLLGLG